MTERQTIKEINKRLDKALGGIVKITWGDAHGSHSINDVDYLIQLAEIESVGFLIYMNPELITLAAFKTVEYRIDYFDDLKDKYRYYIVIPRRSIWRVRQL